MTLVLLTFFAAPALASNVRPASVQIVSLPEVLLHAPRDGRVNGDGFTAQVTGYRFENQFEIGNEVRRAAQGQVLLGFGITSSSNSVTGRLVVDGHAEVLSGEAGYSPVTPTYYLASVPTKAANIALELADNGFAQEFSFTKGQREGPQPSVLYESATGWELTQRVTGSASLSVSGPGGVRETSQQTLLISAALTYFLPGSNAVPSRPSKTWLVVNGSAIPYFASAAAGIPGFSITRPMTGKDVTLTLPGGAAMTAKTAIGPAGSLFNGTYYWQVSANTSTATLKMSLPPVAPSGPGASAAPGVFRAKVSANPVELDFLGPNSPPTTVGTSGPFPTSTLTPRSTGHGHRVASEGTGKPQRGPVPWWLFVPTVLVIAVVTGLLLWWRGVLPAWAPGGRRAGGSDLRARHGRQTSASLAQPVSLASGGTPAVSALDTTANPERTPPLSASGGTVLGASPLPEGAVLQMVGNVRLVRLPEPTEGATDVPQLPSFAVEHASSPDSTAGTPLSSGPAPAPGPPSATSGQVLVPVPAAPPGLPDGSKELQVLGQLRLIAAPGGRVELAASEMELLARLAIEPGRSFTSEELRADIGTAKDTDWARTTLWTRASALRRAIGTDHVPSSSKVGGYRVVGIGTDVARFEAAISRSKAEPDRAVAHLAEALSLVRGAPFASVPVTTFGWALDGGGLATRLANRIYDTSVELARLAVGAGNAELAAWAVTQGRLVSRNDELLDELELDAAAVSPEHSTLTRTWANTKRRYRTARKTVPRQLVEHYQELREKRTQGR